MEGRVSHHLRDVRDIYERESVKRSQRDMKRKTSDIQTWKRNLFLDISSTNIDTLVPSLYQCVETRSKEAF
jgi:cytidylate kinase